MKSFQKGDAENNQPSRSSPLGADQLSDEVLLNAVARGSVWAMETLYDRPADEIFAAAKDVVTQNGVLLNEGTVFGQTNTVNQIAKTISGCNSVKSPTYP